MVQDATVPALEELVVLIVAIGMLMEPFAVIQVIMDVVEHVGKKEIHLAVQEHHHLVVLILVMIYRVSQSMEEYAQQEVK
jgi:hypothetical protein